MKQLKFLKTISSLDISGGIEVSINLIDDYIAICYGGGNSYKALVNASGELLVKAPGTETLIGTSNTKLDSVISNLTSIDNEIGLAFHPMDKIAYNNTRVNSRNSDGYPLVIQFRQGATVVKTLTLTYTAENIRDTETWS